LPLLLGSSFRAVIAYTITQASHWCRKHLALLVTHNQHNMPAAGMHEHTHIHDAKTCMQLVSNKLPTDSSCAAARVANADEADLQAHLPETAVLF
jgi:hypothetical protein